MSGEEEEEVTGDDEEKHSVKQLLDEKDGGEKECVTRLRN